MEEVKGGEELGKTIITLYYCRIATVLLLLMEQLGDYNNATCNSMVVTIILLHQTAQI